MLAKRHILHLPLQLEHLQSEHQVAYQGVESLLGPCSGISSARIRWTAVYLRNQSKMQPQHQATTRLDDHPQFDVPISMEALCYCRSWSVPPSLPKSAHDRSLSEGFRNRPTGQANQTQLP